MKKKLLSFVLLILSFYSLSASNLYINWAYPLKTTYSGLSFREMSGVAIFNDKVCVTTRAGGFFVFSKEGKPLFKKKFDGEFLFEPIVIGKHILLAVSEKAILMDASFNQVWSVAGKTAIASTPYLAKEGVYIQFQDDTIYLINQQNGDILANYSYYNENAMSYVKLASPVLVGEKTVFGFSNGLITYFKHKAESAKNSQIVPYYKFKTAGRSNFLQKKEFYDVFSLVSMDDKLFFANGESGGIISGGKIIKKGEMKNKILQIHDKDKILGFGEGGLFLFGKNGETERKILDIDNFVSSFTQTENFTLVFEMEGKLRILDKDMNKTLSVINIPYGVSSKVAVYQKDSFYFLSNRGVLYSASIY